MRSEITKEQLRTFVLIFTVGILVGLVLLAKYFFEGIVYTFMLIFAITILIAFPTIMKFAGIRGEPSNKLYGVGKNWIRGIFIGLGVGILFLILTKIKIFGAVLQMAVPTLPLSLTGQGTVVIGIAPLAEEAFFTMAILSVLGLFMPFWLAAILKAVAFSSYHYFAYVVYGGSSISSVVGAFVGAALFGFVSAYIAKYVGLEGSATAHGFFNFWNFNEAFHIFSVVG